MAEFTINSATTTDFSSTVKDVTISPLTPDEAVAGFRYWNFPDANENLGYYHSMPELKSALHVFAQRVAGLGWTTESPLTKTTLEMIRGWGKDTFDSIMRMMVIEKKVFGDALAEIVTLDNVPIKKGGKLINIKKLYPGSMSLVINPQGLIEEYQYRTGSETRKLTPDQVLHLVNDRIANEMHGTSVIRSLKKRLDAKNQALTDEVLIRHRDKALGIVYYKTDDAGKITYANQQIADAVNKGEMLGLPEDTAKIEQFPTKSPSDRIGWLQYVDNSFYQEVGTPKVLVTSEGFTEAGGKAGLLAFEPTEISEKKELEQDLWNQLGIRITFTRAPSLLGNEQNTQSKNAGQVGIQPNEPIVSATRTE